MTARTMPPLLPLPSELRAALQAAANRLAGAAPLLDSEVDVHAFVAQLEGMRRYALMIIPAMGQQETR